MKNVIYDCLKQLIKNSLSIRKKLGKDYIDSISKKAYLKEYCTIKISGSRQSGHTTAIKKLLEKFKNPIVLVKEERLKKIYYCENVDKNDCFLFDSILNQMRGIDLKDVDVVFIDNASFMSQKAIELLYDCLCYSSAGCCPIIIFVQ